jgi:hypothetical protein
MSLHFSLALNQTGELKQIVDPEQRSPCRHRDEGVRWRCARPRRGHSFQLAAILVIDPVLTPRTPPVDQLELATAQWMEWVGDANERCLISLIACSRLLFRKARWSAGFGPCACS